MKHYLFSLGLMLSSTVQADDITKIDWDVLSIDSVQLPVYCENIPLASDYNDYDFKVKVEYPEWAPLSKAEAELAARHNVAAQLNVTTHVATMNRKGFLNLSFVPIVKEGDEYRKLVSCRVTVEASRLLVRVRKVASRAATGSSSVLSEGRWVKIATTTEGVHAISRSQLAKWGFNDPAKVRVYGYGGHLLPEHMTPENFFDDLPEVPVYLREDGTLMFWMNGLVNFDNRSLLYFNDQPRHTTNYCANKAYYFLTDGEPTKMEEASLGEETEYEITSFAHTVLHEKDEYSYAPMGRHLFEKTNFSSSSTMKYTLPTPQRVADSQTRVVISATGTQPGMVYPYIDGNKVSTIVLKTPEEYNVASVQKQQYLVNLDSEEMEVKLERSIFNGHLDYIEATYERALSLGNTEKSEGLVFQPKEQGSVTFKIDNKVGDETVVWRLPEPGLPGARIMPDAEGNFRVSDAQHTFVAFRPAEVYLTPTEATVIPNQNLRADSTEVDMVIITPASGIFDSEAERLVRAHAETDGLRCRVVRADKIYNEFSSGTPDISAYRMYMKMLYNRQQAAPRYLLLFGDCAADNRMLSSNWRHFSTDNFLLCYESENSVSDIDSYMCEEYLGMMDDGEGSFLTSDMSDISVGRFPVRSQAEARVMVDKTIAHLKGQSGAWNNRIAILGDDGDNNSHMKYAEEVAQTIEQVAPDMEVHRVMWDAYKRESSALTNTFPGAASEIQRLNNEGVLMFNYTGHGSAYVLSHESVIKLEEIKSWTNRHRPLWFTAACDVMPMDGAAESIGEQMVLNPNGGATTFIGTARTVKTTPNKYINDAFCRYLFGTNASGQRNSVGDALRLAKNSGGVANTENKLQYTLAGDPSLVYGNPNYKVVLDSINGTPAGGQQLRAGSRASMTGHIVDASGNEVTNFDGTINTRVLDSEVKVTCYNAAKQSAGAFTYTDRNKVLYEGIDSVRGGKFNLTFVVPVDINYSDKPGRVNFYASASDTLEANGHSTQFIVGGISDELAADTLGPAMFITLRDEEFENGGRVNSTPCFIAVLHDDSGINTGTGGIGHNLELSVDGKAAMTYDLSSYYTAEPEAFGRGRVTFTMPEMEAGEHTLTFRACDLLNNYSTRSLSFVVDKNFTPDVAQVSLSPNPATTHTNIYVTHNCAGSHMDVEINVYDYAGRLLHTFTRTGSDATPTVYIDWDLTVAGGNRLGAGIYLLRARICRDGVWSDGETQKLFITK